MRVPDIIIAVDGYSSTGKSTFAKLVAKKFSFQYLDSGAMYRGVTLYAQEAGLISPENVISDSLRDALETLDLHFGVGGTYIGERCIEKEIRTMKVSSQVSPIATVPYVREYVDGRLHSFASEGRVVMDGRDIGTVVLPDADVKIFLCADVETRARRRCLELEQRGTPKPFDEVLHEMEQRDYNDTHRAAAPLRPADDAIMIDNTDMDFAASLELLLDVIRGSVER